MTGELPREGEGEGRREREEGGAPPPPSLRPLRRRRGGWGTAWGAAALGAGSARAAPGERCGREEGHLAEDGRTIGFMNAIYIMYVFIQSIYCSYYVAIYKTNFGYPIRFRVSAVFDFGDEFSPKLVFGADSDFKFQFRV